MKIFELSRQLKVGNKELIQKIDDPRVKSHMSKVPEEIAADLLGEEKKIDTPVEESTETVDTAETVLVEPVEPVVEIPSKEECPVSLEDLRAGIHGLGGKYKHYKWKHLLDA